MKLYVEIFKLADSDDSGKINFKEFLETSFDLEDELNH
jgi:hypothetical protein